MGLPQLRSPLQLARDRYLAGDRAVAEANLVAVVGASVPIEVILAGGFIPVRISGRGGTTPLAHRYGLHELDIASRIAFERLATEKQQFAFGLIGSDRAAHSVVFQTLREIQRVEPLAGVVPFSFIDVLNLPNRTTARYNRGQLLRMIELVSDSSGAKVDYDRLRDGIASVNLTRSMLAGVMSRRRERPARLSGTEALSLVGAGLISPVREFQTWLSDLLEVIASLPEKTGARVYLTGSAHDDSSVYELIESCDCVVVGEDHPLGEDAFGAPVSLDGDLIENLVAHYQFANLPAKRLSSERAQYTISAAQRAGADVVVSYAAQGDQAVPWDTPALRAAAQAADLAMITLDPNDLGHADLSLLENKLAVASSGGRTPA